MSFPRYESYKDSGIEWLGEVPEHWEVRAIKHIVSTPITDGPHETPNFPDEGIPFVSAEAVSTGVIDFSKIRGFISEVEHLRYSQKYHPKIGDIYMVKSGATTGVTAIVETDREFNIWSPLAAIRCGEIAVPRFILNFMRSKNFQEAVTLNWSFGTQQNIGMGVIENLAVALPPTSEQATIVAFLDCETAKINELISEQKNLIKLLKEKRQAVISHVVTKGLNPAAPMKDSGIEWLGEVPEHWMMKRLKNISPFIAVGIVVNPSEYVAEEGLPFIYGGDISEGKIDTQSCRRISRADSDKNAKTRLEAGDLLTVRVGAPGITAVVTEECEGGNCASVMLTRKGNFESRWLCYAMNNRMVRFQVEVVQYGAAQQQFNISHAINFCIATPPPDEQSAITAFLDSETAKFNDLTAEAKIVIALLQERRTALISAAVTGKIDVRDLLPSKPEVEQAA